MKFRSYLLSCCALIAVFPFGDIVAQQETRTPEARSLLGRDLFAPELPSSSRARLEGQLEGVRKRLEVNPRHHDHLIWLGRRTAYLGRYREAVEIFGRALELYPQSAAPYRHRGHRWITLRRFDQAISDFEKAVELSQGRRDRIEADGAPNRLLVPTSTLQTNIWYHLGLAHYLKGDFEEAESAYRRCLALSRNDDMLAATAHWLYMTLRRRGDEEGAEALLSTLPDKLNVIENRAYADLVDLYRGRRSLDDLQGDGEDGVQLATLGYGIANWHFYNGRVEPAKDIFRRVVDGVSWAAFGAIAAEAELARQP